MKYLIGLVAAVILAGAGYAFINPSTPEDGGNIGSASSPSLNGVCYDLNGVKACYQATRMAIASTTCSFKITATSTLQRAAAKVSRSSTGSALQYEWGFSTSPNATTTSYGIGSIGSGAQGTVTASTTASGDATDQEITLGPGYFNLKIGSTTPTTQSGVCVLSTIEL